MSVSAVVCAYTVRRWSDTVRAVDSLLAQEPVPDEVVLVVDHAPDLAARATVPWFSEPRVRVVENRHARGLSGARNTGLDEVTGDVVAFLDDDATARPGWLAALLAPYDDPSVIAVGGRAEPRWPGADAPGCLPAELLWVVGCSYAGQAPPGDVREVRNVMGCSMSFRRAPVADVGGFTEALGRRGTAPLGCEETDLCIRLRQAVPDGRVLLAPDAVVDHRVSPDRTTWSYLLRRCWAEGRSKAVLASAVGSRDGLAAERAYTRSVLPRAFGRELVGVLDALQEGPWRRLGRTLAAVGALPGAVLATAAGYVRGRVGSVVTGDGDAAAGHRRVAAAVLLVLGAVACATAAADWPGPLRFAATAAFLLLAPGWAIVGFLRRLPVSTTWACAVGAGLAVGLLVGQGMAVTGAWQPVTALYVVAAACAPALARHAVAGP